MIKKVFFILSFFFLSQNMCANEGEIISTTPFIPEAYEKLHERDQVNYTKEVYDSLMNWQKITNDVEFKRIVYKSDGLKVVGVIAQPTTIDPTKKLPVIIFNRGGFGEAGKIEASMLRAFFYPMVKAGYIVVASQYRGNDGGEGVDMLGGDDIHDILNLKTVIDQIPYADSSNIFMFGISRGGMMTYLALKHKMPIKAAATCCGVADMLLLENHPIMKKELLAFFAGRENSRFAEYDKRSAINWADQINTPLLLFHAKDDPIVTIDHSLKLVQKLQDYKKPHKLITYEQGGHMLSGHLDDIIVQTAHWFSNYKS